MYGVARLLLLEDDDGIRTSLRMALEDEGYHVDEAADAESALEMIERRAPDLMLVDLMLGGMDGFTFIRRVRPGSDVPIIVLSARSTTVDIVSALEAGADDYVTKPFVVTRGQRAVAGAAAARAKFQEPRVDLGRVAERQRTPRRPGPPGPRRR